MNLPNKLTLARIALVPVFIDVYKRQDSEGRALRPGAAYEIQNGALVRLDLPGQGE